MTLFMLALPADYNLLEVLYLFAGYYAVHVAILFFYLGVYGGCLRRRRFKWGVMCVSICLAFLLGMQGARGMLVIYGPAFAVEMIRFGYLLWIRIKPKWIDWGISIWVLLNFLFNFLGSCLPVSVNVGFSRNIRKGFYKLWSIVIPDIADILGFHSIGLFGQICLGILALNAFCILLWTINKIWKKSELRALDWIFLVVCASPVMTSLMVAFTTVESTGRYYFGFLLTLSMGAVMLLIQRERYMILPQVLCWVAIGYLSVVNILSLYIPVMRSKESPETDYTAVTEFLEENEYLLAYATFENANTMTMISNGRVRVAPVASIGRMDCCKWLSSKSWYPPYVAKEQTTAYVVTESQMPEFAVFLSGKEEQVKKVQKIGKFNIYVSDYNYVN